MTYSEALAYLGQTRRFGMKLGLESMCALARTLGNPQDRLRFIHLAGTNGKGSTAAFCESCLQASGFRVGLFTSPHLVSVRERIQINRIPITEADFVEGMAKVRSAVEKSTHQEVTYFEIMTALALWYFGRERVDWVVWETGLGGRLDATNIVQPELCIITNIGLDHQQYLGHTLREIGSEKAGIMKPGKAVISAVDIGEASETICGHAKAVKCPVTLIRRDCVMKDCGLRAGRQVAEIDGVEYELGLSGPHQIANAACAVKAMQQLRAGNYPRQDEKFYSIPNEAIASGLKKTVWPGRFEILSEKPLIVIDGAHNPAGTKMLVQTWRTFLAARFGWSAEESQRRTRLVFAAAADKDISETAQMLGPLARELYLVRLASERAADPRAMAKAFTGWPCHCYDSVAALWQQIVNADPETVTLAAGSLFLVGEMLALQQGSTEEYRLNERLEKTSANR